MMELIYVSRARKRYDEQQITQLLSVAREKNAHANITGLLLYDGLGTFIQVLEGEQEVISQLFSIIKKDSRHERVNVLWQDSIKKRKFADWRMGFRYMSEFKAQNLAGYSDFLGSRQKSDFLSDQPGFVRDMLLFFKSQLSQKGECL